ncbi:hydantoinase/oxoprolinase family protein [Planctomicrobium sp. SH527]|uniref:hydantoinase/oxoprolinase family protein n=1 Tax=Planctomicrobium sp. SH527 TaxID=3448123 RepID=UPI003F5C7DA0
MSTPIGLDIGGANIKAADGKVALSVPFALWKEPENLPQALSSILNTFPAGSPLAVTMTGELADCFETKAIGVHHILSAVEQAGSGRFIGVWQTAGEFVSVEDARDLPSLVAAANWHALATWAGRIAPVGRGLVVDIGSTTTDIIPIEDGLPMTRGTTDRERLATGELLYLGVRRTPLNSLVNEVTVKGRRTTLARESFATTHDLHVILKDLPEEPQNCETSNGRPMTIEHAKVRLARMLCSDLDETQDDEILDLAKSLSTIEQLLFLGAFRRAWASQEVPHAILLAGEGEFLARRALQGAALFPSDMEILSLQSLMGPQHSIAACAEALSRLAIERNFEQHGSFF